MATIMPCERISWQQVQRSARQVAYQIHQSSYQADIIIAIGRGGYVPARLLADYLDMMALTSIKIEHYQRGADKQSAAMIKYPVCHDIAGQKVLLVDDVSDSGDTYQLALEHLQGFRPAEIKTAALDYKAGSSYRPDYYANLITDWRWLTYPWAVMEDIAGFMQRSNLSDNSTAEIIEGLKRGYGIDVTEEIVEDVVRLIIHRPDEALAGQTGNKA